MSIPARQSTARTVTIGPVLAEDGVAVTDAVVGDLKISKNGAAPAALNGSATLTHRNTGHYSLALTASDLGTVGMAEIVIDDTANAMPVKSIAVIEEAVYDAIYASGATGLLPANLTHAGGNQLNPAVIVAGSGRLAVRTEEIGPSVITPTSIESGALAGKGDWNTTTPPTTAQIEAALINEGDGQQLIDAILQVINNNLDLPALELTAIAQQVRAELATELARIDVPTSSRSSHAAPDLSDATAAKVAAQAVNDRLTTARAAKLDRNVAAVGDTMTIDMTQATPGASTVGDKLDAAGTGGDAVKLDALETKLDTVLARTAGGIVVSSEFLDVDGKTLLLRQGEAYISAANNALEIAVKDTRLTSAVTGDGTTPKLKLTPRNKVGAATTLAGTVIAFHSETSTVDLRFELNATASAALKAGARVYRWDIDIELAGNANNVLAGVIDHPCTVAEQVV